MNLLIVPYISSTDLLPASVFCKIHPLVANLFPVKIKQLPKAGRVKHFVKNWQRLTNDPMILDIVNGYEIPFILPPRQSRLPNLCQLTKEASDLVDQEVQDMLRKGAIVVSDLKGGQFLSSLFLVKKKDGQLGKLLKTTYRSSFRRAPSKKVSIRPSTYQKTRWSTF